MRARVLLYDDEGAPLGEYEGAAGSVIISPDTVEEPILDRTGLYEVGHKLTRTGKVAVRVLFDTFEVKR